MKEGTIENILVGQWESESALAMNVVFLGSGVPV